MLLEENNMFWQIIGNIIMWPFFGILIWGAYVSKTTLGRVFCIVIAIAIFICIVVTIKDIVKEKKG